MDAPWRLTEWADVCKIQPNIDRDPIQMQISRFFAPYYYYGNRCPAAVGGA
jgi:hypothetical protein